MNSNLEPEKLRKSEKEQSIQFIMNNLSLQPKNFNQFIVTFFKSMDYRLVFWGMKDVFLLLLLGIFCLVCLFLVLIPTRLTSSNVFGNSLTQNAYLYVFVSAPCLFSMLHYLSIWKEVQQKTFELKMTLKTSLKEVMIIRTLLMSGITVFLSVLLSFFVWLMLNQEVSLLKLISVSSASLFLFATSQLLLDQIIPLHLSYKLSPVIWLIVGTIIIINGEFIVKIIVVLPEILFFVLTLLFIISFISVLKYGFHQKSEGVISHVRV